MEVTANVVYVVIAAAVVIGLVVFLTTRSRGKTRTRMDFLRGLITFEGESEQPTKDETLANSLSNDEPPDLALEVIKYIKETSHPEKVTGNYGVTETKQANWVIAARLYTKLDGDIIGTEFFEMPYYGRSDLASGIRKGATFHRLSVRQMCSSESEKSLNEVFSKIECDAKLIVLPENTEISKMGGVFCKFPDSSYLAFIALNNYGDNGGNRGVVFSGAIAQQLYQYYRSFIK